MKEQTKDNHDKKRERPRPKKPLMDAYGSEEERVQEMRKLSALIDKFRGS